MIVHVSRYAVIAEMHLINACFHNFVCPNIRKPVFVWYFFLTSLSPFTLCCHVPGEQPTEKIDHHTKKSVLEGNHTFSRAFFIRKQKNVRKTGPVALTVSITSAIEWIQSAGNADSEIWLKMVRTKRRRWQASKLTVIKSNYWNCLQLSVEYFVVAIYSNYCFFNSHWKNDLWLRAGPSDNVILGTEDIVA